MKKAAVTLFCLLCLATFSFSNGATTPLESSMKKMGKAYKQLSLDLKTPQDAGKPDYLALAATLKSEAQTARGFVPAKAAALPPDQQAAMVAAYQKSIDELSASIDVLSQEIQDGKWADATKQIDTLKQQMFAGHKEFRIKK